MFSLEKFSRNYLHIFGPLSGWSPMGGSWRALHLLFVHKIPVAPCPSPPHTHTSFLSQSLIKRSFTYCLALFFLMDWLSPSGRNLSQKILDLTGSFRSLPVILSNSSFRCCALICAHARTHTHTHTHTHTFQLPFSYL